MRPSILPLFMLLACSGDKSDASPPSDADSDTDTDSDTHADTDTDTSDDSGHDSGNDSGHDSGTGDTWVIPPIGTGDTGPIETGTLTDTHASDTSDTAPNADTHSAADTSDTGAVSFLGEASVVLVHRLDAPTLFAEHMALTGLFVDDLQGFTNAAECHPVYGYLCDPGMSGPATDDWVDASTFFDGGAATSFRAGGFVDVGPYAAPGSVGPASYDARLYHLEDDGVYDLDVADLPFSGPGAVAVILGRRTSARVPTAGGPIEWVARSDHAYGASSGPYSLSIERTGANLADAYQTCLDATAAPALPPGDHLLTLAGRTDVLNPALHSCVAACDLADSCIVGHDAYGFTTYRECLQYTHAGPPSTYFLVLDAYTTGDTFWLTVDID